MPTPSRWSEEKHEAADLKLAATMFADGRLTFEGMVEAVAEIGERRKRRVAAAARKKPAGKS